PAAPATPSAGVGGVVTPGNQHSTSPTGWAVATDAGVNTTQVFVFRTDGSLAMSVTPFGDGYRGGVRIARADINGDGVPDLLTGSGAGIAARLRVWDGVSAAMIVDLDPFPGYAG